MLRKLFGRRGGETSQTTHGDAEIAARERYKGVELRAAPIREGGVWRVAGSIAGFDSGEQEPQAFVRSDTCASHDDAVAISLRKARQIVDEQDALAGGD